MDEQKTAAMENEKRRKDEGKKKEVGPPAWMDLGNLWETLVITVAVMGSALIILAAARNTVTW